MALQIGCSRAPKKAKGADEHQATLSKLDAYTSGCLDQAERIFAIGDRYRARFGATPPATPGDLVVAGSPDPEGCVAQIERVKDEAPSLPELEAAAAAYGRAMTAVFTATKARDHAALIAAFRDFDTAHGVLFDQVYRLNHDLRRQQLARRQDDEGRTYGVIADDLMIRGEGLVRFGAIRWDRVDAIDVAAMNAELAQFERTLDELAEYVGDGADKAEPRMDRFPEISTYAKAYLVAAKQLASRASGKIPFSDAEKIMIAADNEIAVVGAPAPMITAYNNLVTAYIRP